jgi:hypothetical protein
MDEGKFTDGHAFDGSSIAGWKGIEASDMLLMPDPSTAHMDPFREESTMIITCDVLEPTDMKGYERDPRSLAKRAEAYLKSSGLGDTAFFGPEPEFFVFDGVTWGDDPISLESPFAGRILELGGLTIPMVDAVIIVATVLLTTSLYFFFARTRLGVAMQACSQPDTAGNCASKPGAGRIQLATLATHTSATVKRLAAKCAWPWACWACRCDSSTAKGTFKRFSACSASSGLRWSAGMAMRCISTVSASFSSSVTVQKLQRRVSASSRGVAGLIDWPLAWPCTRAM